MSNDASHRSTFFRQSGWLMFATITGGFLMYAVHVLARKTGPEEYGIFQAFLGWAMAVPAAPLQMVLAQQTAKALATRKEGQLAGMIRSIWLIITLLWVVAAVLLLVFEKRVLAAMQIQSAAPFLITLPVLLLSAWMPFFQGVLQGKQEFFWLGWSMMSNGVGRVIIAALAVLLFAWGATGMLGGVLVGLIAACGMAVWFSREQWRRAPEPYDWQALLKQIMPLVLACGAFQFMMTADIMFSKVFFSPKTFGVYSSAGTLSRALMWLVGPLATVMFPRIVHSTARAEKTDIMSLVLVGTAILALGGAVGLSFVGPFVVQLIYGPEYVPLSSALMPWYAFAMVPLALANVLLNNLLARLNFRVVPGACLLAIAYPFALFRFHSRPEAVLQTMGIFNTLLLVLCGYFTWGFGRTPGLKQKS